MKTSLPRSFLLVGDPFLVGEKAKSLAETIQKEIKGELFRQTFYLADTPLEAVLLQAGTLPFLAAAQLFQIRDVHKAGDKDLEMLGRYLDRPSERSYLIFETEPKEKIEPLIEMFRRKAEVLLLAAGDQKTMTHQFVREKLKQAGKTITSQAMELLQQSAGDMPAFMDSMVERLIVYAGERSEITDEMVQIFEENWEEANVFHLTDAVADKNLSKALMLLKDLLENSEKDIIGVLGMLHWQLRRLWIAALLLEEGAPQSDMLKKCRISSRQAPYFIRQARQFSRKRLEDAIEGLFQLDWQMKTGRVDGRSALESWFVGLVSSPQK